MNRSRSTRFVREAAAIAALTCAIGRGGDALAQACCSGANTVSPARLALGEDALLAAQLHMGWQTGSYDLRGKYLSAPNGSREANFGQDIVGAMSVVERAQIAVLLPIVENYRRQGGLSEAGWGFGDMNLAGRYDFWLAGESEIVPGIALLAGVTLPTGTPPDRAKNLLSTDATGIGVAQGSVGAAVEQVFAGHLLISLNGIVTKRLPRQVQEVRSQLGFNLALALSIGWVFDPAYGVALVVRHEREGEAVTNGTPEPGRRLTSIGVATGLALDRDWRVQASLVAMPPISDLGQNLPATVTLTTALIRTWL
jgi:outer membrane putative beta-barrel porin/alpha-amylase